jgi:hypothetical protein
MSIESQKNEENEERSWLAFGGYQYQSMPSICLADSCVWPKIFSAK